MIDLFFEISKSLTIIMLALTLESKKFLEILKKLTILNLQYYKLNYKNCNAEQLKMQNPKTREKNNN